MSRILLTPQAVLWAIYVTVFVVSVLFELQYTAESVVMAGSTILAAWAGSIWENGAAMLVVPENKVTRSLHLSHYISVNPTLIYNTANTLYQYIKFQNNSNEIIIHFHKHNNGVYQHGQQMLDQFISQTTNLLARHIHTRQHAYPCHLGVFFSYLFCTSEH
jgi:hypothetical protein